LHCYSSFDRVAGASSTGGAAALFMKFRMKKTGESISTCLSDKLCQTLGAGFLRQAKPGPRCRTDYLVTATGKRLLKDGWLPLIEAGPSGDADAFRIADALEIR
jgi:hypothetical protein